MSAINLPQSTDAKALRRYPRGILDRRSYQEPARSSVATLAELFLEAYGDPDPFASLEQMLRHDHADLEGMSLEALDRERIHAMMRDAFAPGADSAWFRERRAKIDVYARRRRR